MRCLILIPAQWPELPDRAEDMYGNGRCLTKIRIVTAAGEVYLEDVGLAYKNSLCSLWTAAFPSGIPFMQLKQWWEIRSEPQRGAGEGTECCCFQSWCPLHWRSSEQAAKPDLRAARL